MVKARTPRGHVIVRVAAPRHGVKTLVGDPVFGIQCGSANLPCLQNLSGRGDERYHP